jgi:hypothetical protein
MNAMAEQLLALTQKKYISKTEAVVIHRTHHFTLAKLINEGKIELHLIDGRVMLDAEEVTREIQNVRLKKSKVSIDLFA